MDMSKQIFQLHGVDDAGEPVLRRRDLGGFFSKLAPTFVGIEACAGAHHWARVLSGLGHEVRLLHAQFVKPYVKRNKNDAADAEALCEAMSRPSMRFVAAKTAEEQAALMLYRRRERLIADRTRLANAVRGHAAAFGLIAPRGLDKMEPLLLRACGDVSLPALARAVFADLARDYARLAEELKAVEARLLAWQRSMPASRRLEAIPGIGPITAALLTMKVTDPHGFRSGRHFAAWVGLTPKDHSSGGKQRLGGISRAGDEALRRLLVIGATAVIQQVRRGRGADWPWLAALLTRKPPKLAAVALANKMARIAWKLMTTDTDYDRSRAAAAARPA